MISHLLVRKRITERRSRKRAQPAPAMIPAEYSPAIFGAKMPEI